MSQEINNKCWWCGRPIEWGEILCPLDSSKKEEATAWDNGIMKIRFIPRFNFSAKQPSLTFHTRIEPKLGY